MGESISLKAKDGHTLQAYLATPPANAKPRGAIVVIQEIFGVNSHIRSVTDGFAKDGYTAIAPAFFDRVRPGVELGYTQPDVQEGKGYAQKLKLEETMQDLGAAVESVKSSGKVGTVGYCWGGAMSYVAASQLPIACAVVYYGNAANFPDRKPKCPVMYHFGTQDKSIPMSDVEKIKAAHPQGIFHEYEAGHGFSATPRDSFNPQAAALARQRTLEFFGRHLGG
jgi:carboxymethylenebutenolidase